MKLVGLFILSMSFWAYCSSSSCPQFVFVVASFNNKRWYKDNLDSIFAQDYKHYRVIYIDDVSTDGTADLVEEYVKEKGFEEKFTLIRNKEKRLKVANFYDAIQSCDDNEIILELDGDDWLFDKHSLAAVAQAYEDPNVWMTYGQYVEDLAYRRHMQGGGLPSSSKAKAVPDDIIRQNEFREYRWVTMHMRTFYAWLFKAIKLEDLLDSEGNFYGVTGDMVMAYPMLEMAGFHSKFLGRLVYVYNKHSPLNDHRMRSNDQVFTEMLIRKKSRYQPLSRPRINYLDQYKDKKVNVILVATDPDKTKKSVEVLESMNHKSIQNLTIIYDQKLTLPKKFEMPVKLIAVDYAVAGNLNYIVFHALNSSCDYTILMNDLGSDYNDYPSLQRSIRELEKTQTQAVFLHAKKDTFALAPTWLCNDLFVIHMKHAVRENFFSSPYMVLYKTEELALNLKEAQIIDGNASTRLKLSRFGIIIDTTYLAQTEYVCG